MSCVSACTINTKRLAQLIKESNKNGTRFCFILGSGASAESGIDAGNKLEKMWMDCLMGRKADLGSPPMDPIATEVVAKQLKASNLLKHDFEEIKGAWEDADQKNRDTLPSEYYFDIYKLRFFPDLRNGYRFLERIMDNRSPSPGYHVLSKLMTEPTAGPESDVPLNNLVITTNFDSLTEDALFLYSKKKPLVVAHEALAGFMGTDTTRPIVAKVHRDVRLAPLNTTEETDGLKEEWESALQYAFNTYTPIVIGYGGGDGSLMKYLKEKATINTVYWCFLKKYGIPDDTDIQHFVKEKNGCFVEIEGFDSLMTILGEDIYGRTIFPEETEAYLIGQAKERIRTYREKWQNIRETPEVNKALAPVEEDLKKEAEKRAEEGTLTAWDHIHRGNMARDNVDYKKAVEEYSKAIELDPENAAAYNNLGNTYGALGDHAKALEYKQKALAIREKVLPADHPDLATSYDNLGVTYGALGDPAKALEYKQKALAIMEKVLPADHPDLAGSYNNLGVTYVALGDPAKALKSLKRAFGIYSKSLPHGHPYTKIVCRNIIHIYAKLDDQENVSIWEKILADLEKPS